MITNLEAHHSYLPLFKLEDAFQASIHFENLTLSQLK